MNGKFYRVDSRFFSPRLEIAITGKKS